MEQMDHAIAVRKKILVLDDDPLSHLIITETLKNDFDLVFTLNSKTALELATKVEFDGLLIDYYIGNKNETGIDVLNMIKPLVLNKNAIFIAITASVHPAISEKIVDAGFNLLFQKPIVKEDIIRIFK